MSASAFAEAREDTLGWFNANYASIDAFEGMVKSLPGYGEAMKARKQSSGHNPSKSFEASGSMLNEEDRAVALEAGLDLSLASVTSLEGYKKLRAAEGGK